MKRNLSGLPDATDLFLGRGRTYFGYNDGSTISGTSFVRYAYRGLGNIGELTIGAESSELEHFSSRLGASVRDARVALQQSITLSLTCEEFNTDNLALFLSGEASAYVNPHKTETITDSLLTDEAVQGRWYLLHNAVGLRLYDLIGTVQIAGAPALASLRTEGTDYVLDRLGGRIYVIVGGAISAGSSLYLTIATPQAAAANPDEVKILTQNFVEGPLVFLAMNATGDGRTGMLELHKVTLSPNGEAGWIADEYGTLPLSGSTSTSSESRHAAAPTGWLRVLDGGYGAHSTNFTGGGIPY